MADVVADVALPNVLEAGASAMLMYRVPESLQADVQPGQLVWVPLRKKQIQGVVLHTYRREADTQPRHTLRDIVAIADPVARISSIGLQLARWLAETYQSRLYDALSLWLPPGVSQEMLMVWQLTLAGMHADPGALPEVERAVLYYLQKQSDTPEPELLKALKGSADRIKEACMLLKERGLLTTRTTSSRTAARPRYEAYARLLVPHEDLEQTLAQLKRASKQQAVVRWLAEQQHEQQATTVWAQRAAPQWPVRAITVATSASVAVLRSLEAKGVIALEQHEVWRDPLERTMTTVEPAPPLTAAQQAVWETLATAMAPTDGQPPVFLLHGVTGSGKTEIYLRAVAHALQQGRQALVLVPEIALTTQLVRRFAARLPGQLAVLHSGLSMGERYDAWRRLQRGDAMVAMGSRSAVFAPLERPGIIIVDEEHEPGYKNDNTPRYDARRVVQQLGQLTDCVVVLGSATPSVERYEAAQAGRVVLLNLSERVGPGRATDGTSSMQVLPLPRVELIDMRRELHDNHRSMLSRALQQALTSTLERGEQAILFLNRRGDATFVLCRDCGAVVQCPDCSAALTVHQSATGASDRASTATHSLLHCHTCGYRTSMPVICPQCLSPRIKAFGVGTQRVEAEIRKHFPQARPIRWDRDSATGKGSHDRLLDQFLQHQADVLIGTQLIAKGFDLPQVTLVGVIAADTGLYLPDFRSGERTFQLLTQIAGRAGRRTADARVIIQTYAPEHYALQSARLHDYHGFYRQEIAFRQRTGYPPFGQLVRLVYQAAPAAAAEQAATALAKRLYLTIEQPGLQSWQIIGPAPAFFQRIRRKWRWHILLRLPRAAMKEHAVATLLQAVGPIPGWMVDVDPINVL